MPSVRARDVRVTEIDGCPVDPDQLIAPLPRCLPMGFSWLLYFCQQSALHTYGICAAVFAELGLLARAEADVGFVCLAGVIEEGLLEGQVPDLFAASGKRR